MQASPDKYCKVHSVIDKLTDCTVEWIKVQRASTAAHGVRTRPVSTQTQSGMDSVEKLEKGELDLAVLGSPPTTIALSPPRSLPLQVVHISTTPFLSI